MSEIKLDDVIVREARPVGVGPYADVDGNAEQMAAWAREREEEYRVTTLLDHELGLGSEREVGNELHAAACADLRARGIEPDMASQAQLAAAYRRAGAR
jgi:hypothetical protein